MCNTELHFISFYLFEFYKFNNIQWIKGRQKGTGISAKDDDKINIYQANIIIKSYNFIFFLIRRGYVDIFLRWQKENKAEVMGGKILDFSSANGIFLLNN